jgi:hypothetical protein
VWQKINEPWLFCHSWRDLNQRMITAMTFLMILLFVVVALSVASVALIVRDGRGPQRLPVSHFEDARFVAPRAR